MFAKPIFRSKFIRNLSLHEYAGMKILQSKGVSVPHGTMVKSAQEAFEFAKNSKFRDFVVKAQVLAGGRGKGTFTNGFVSGVHMVYSPEEVRDITNRMIGNRLITKQTGEEGLPCNMVYVCERLYPRREYYVAFTLDSAFDGPVLVVSGAGGVNIEETAHSTPDSIKKHAIDITKGLQREDAHKVLKSIQFSADTIESGVDELMKLYDVFISRDMVLLEINPFCETTEGRILSMDSKVQVDDNALFRQPEIQSLRDTSQENKFDVIASKHDINYIKLDGTIGCLVNGAGLAMATMDILKLHGGSPANFLDIGGGASVEQVIAAFEILVRDPKVKTIFVNIFGGIMRCDIIAEGIIQAARTLDFKVPLVVRLRGTNSKEAMHMFQQSKLGIYFVEDFDEASKLAVQVAAILSLAHKSNISIKFELPI